MLAQVRLLATWLILTLLVYCGGPIRLVHSEDVEVEPGKINELKLTTEKVIVFKDGYSLIVKRGVAQANEDGEVYTSDVPDSAILGSFWATPSAGRMINMTAGWVETNEEIEKDLPCTEMIEVLQANLGKACVIELRDGTTLTGELVKVLSKPVDSTMTAERQAELGLLMRSAVQVSSSTPPPIPTRIVSGITGSQFVVKSEQGDVLVSISDLKRLTIKEMKTTLRRKVTTKDRAKRLTFRVDQPNKPCEMLITYFRPGVRWIPTYRINLTTNAKGEKIAKITMQAEILNEAEDLLDMPIDIVVGVPNFRFREAVSPLVLEQTMRNALNQAAPNLMGQFRNDFSNSLYSQRSSEVRRNAAQGHGGEGAAVQLPNELTATGAQDLFVYNLPKLKLAKGERTAVHILDTEVPYRDVYTWDLHVRRNDIALAPSGSGVQSPLALSQNKVWRQIELINNTKLPWTTGAAMIMQGQQPLAQELLTYTSPTDFCRVPVTVSVDTRGSYEESEVNRQLNALRWNGHNYARIDQRAKLDLCNNKAETINVEITMRFGGKADKVSHDGEITLSPYHQDDWQHYRGDVAVNNRSVVKWKTILKPGETFLPTVDHHFFTRQ